MFTIDSIINIELIRLDFLIVCNKVCCNYVSPVAFLYCDCLLDRFFVGPTYKAGQAGSTGRAVSGRETLLESYNLPISTYSLTTPPPQKNTNRPPSSDLLSSSSPIAPTPPHRLTPSSLSSHPLDASLSPNCQYRSPLFGSHFKAFRPTLVGFVYVKKRYHSPTLITLIVDIQ